MDIKDKAVLTNREKILARLNDHPEGLSLDRLSEATGIPRNSLSSDLVNRAAWGIEKTGRGQEALYSLSGGVPASGGPSPAERCRTLAGEFERQHGHGVGKIIEGTLAALEAYRPGEVAAFAEVLNWSGRWMDRPGRGVKNFIPLVRYTEDGASVEYPLFQFKDNGKILFEWHKARHPKGSESIRRSLLEGLSPILDTLVVDGSIDGRPNPAISVSNLASSEARALFFGCLEKYIAEVRQSTPGGGTTDESGRSGRFKKPQVEEDSSPSNQVGDWASRFLTLKHIVEFAAALIAVIVGIVAFIKWIL
jgi:hypothetical protein